MISYFPSIEASLNALSAVMLVMGYVFIRRKQIQAHQTCMLSAVAASGLFLAFYLTDHFLRGIVYFQGHGAVRTFYLVLLGTHSVLATAIVPLALITLYRAWRQQFAKHKRIARWTLPIWLYVSITGVVVYFMLYHLYPPA